MVIVFPKDVDETSYQALMVNSVSSISRQPPSGQQNGASLVALAAYNSHLKVTNRAPARISMMTLN